MSNAIKYPDLWKKKEAFEAEKAAVLEKSAPLRAEREALQAEIAPAEARIREITKEIREVENNRVFELDNQISALARGMGGKSTRDPE